MVQQRLLHDGAECASRLRRTLRPTGRTDETVGSTALRSRSHDPAHEIVGREPHRGRTGKDSDDPAAVDSAATLPAADDAAAAHSTPADGHLQIVSDGRLEQAVARSAAADRQSTHGQHASALE